jgi:hypothetical protein
MRFGVILGPCVALCAAIAPELAVAQPSDTAPAALPAQSSAGIKLQFRGLTLLGSEPSPDGREITLRLKEPVDPNFVKAMSGQEREWLESVSAGYDTLLIRTTRVARFETAPADDGFTLRILRAGPAEGATRVSLVEARYLTSVGRTTEAREMLDSLRGTDVDELDIAKARADADLADGDAKAAAAAYTTALRTRPSDEGLREALVTANEVFAPQIQAGGEYQRVEGADTQWRAHLAGRLPLDETLSLRGRIEAVDLDDNAVMAPDGVIAAFSGTRERGELGIENDFGAGWFGIARLFAAEDVIGGGLAVEGRAVHTATLIQANFQEPYWDYTEGIVHAGMRDSIAFGHRHAFDNTWFVNLGVRGNRYGIDGDDDVGKSVEVDAGLRWRMLEGPTQVSLGYNYEGEFVSDVEQRSDGLGGFFAPLPIGDRQVHSADVRADTEIAANFTVGGFAGYATDVEGGSGLIAGIEIAYEPTDDLRVAFDAYYSAVGDRAGDSGAYQHASLTITRLFTTDGSASGH